MKVLCEMFINDFFKLSSGHIAIIGDLTPDVESFIPNNSKADLYVAGKKVKAINIIGEDIFSGVDKAKQRAQRSVRTDTDIPRDLKAMRNAKLIIFE